jgi:hypothetical protein
VRGERPSWFGEGWARSVKAQGTLGRAARRAAHARW